MSRRVGWLLYFFVTLALFSLMMAINTAKSEENKSAQPRVPCGPIATLFENLETKYGEHRVWSGIVGENPDGIIVQMLFLSNKGTWSLLRCQRDLCCMQGMGVNGGVFT